MIVVMMTAVLPGMGVVTAQDVIADQDRPKRILLREGSELDAARGRVHRDDQRGVWTFTIEQKPISLHRYEFTLLPCARLAEIVPAVQAEGGAGAVFEVSGRIYAFGDRNYLLPTHAPRLVDFMPVDTEPAPAPATNDEASSADAGGDDTEAGSLADQLMQDIDREVGPLAHAAVGNDDGTAAESDRRLPRDGTLLIDRRGTVRRDHLGAYIFVFDADAEGLSDPPMVILPCRLLESIARIGRRGDSAPLLISGTAYAYRGHAYVLPTAVRIARGRTSLSP